MNIFLIPLLVAKENVGEKRNKVLNFWSILFFFPEQKTWVGDAGPLISRLLEF